VPEFSIDTLEEIAAEVIGLTDLRLVPSMSAKDVPGWDSLNHTLIALEIGARFHIEVSAERTGKCPNFGAMVGMIRDEISKRPGSSQV
jgi:acyl carrier protein